MLTIHVWPKRLKEFLLTHTLYKSPVFLEEVPQFFQGLPNVCEALRGLGRF